MRKRLIELELDPSLYEVFVRVAARRGVPVKIAIEGFLAEAMLKVMNERRAGVLDEVHSVPEVGRVPEPGLQRPEGEVVHEPGAEASGDRGDRDRAGEE